MDIYKYSIDTIQNDKDRVTYLRETFEKMMRRLRRYIVCGELNVMSNPMVYVFEHIKDAIVEIITAFIPEEQREYLSSKKWHDIKWRKTLLDILVGLGYRPIILWLFLHTSYFHLENLDDQRRMLLENIELLKKFYPKSLYFQRIDDFYNAVRINLVYSLSYQNRNNRQIMESICKLYRTICPDLTYIGVPPKRPNTKPKENKIRVGFFSEFLTEDSSVLRDRLGTITKLPRSKFDVYYFSFMEKKNIKGKLSKFVHGKLKKFYIVLPEGDLQQARRMIVKKKLDVLVYCEIGMRVKPMLMAYSRLAPVQITTWGHSETSGIDTIDYFISSKYFETDYPNAKQHYSEKLICMNSLSTYYFKPSQLMIPPDFKFKTRKELELDPKVNLYGCIQSSFKINLQYEAILKSILDKDPNGYIMMSYYKPFCKSQMDRIYESFGEETFKRLIFYPALDVDVYLNLVKLMDVMLDPYPFGGCNTTFESLDFDVPVITMPTKFINGRFTFGLYRHMGFIDLVADSPQKYVDLAVKCATNKSFKQNMIKKIKANKEKLFQEQASVDEWSDVLEKMANGINMWG